MEVGIIEQKQVGNYIIGDEIGKGAFATVYLATNVRTKQQFAIKIFPKSNLSSQEEEERFQREINAMALINHPGIVSLRNLLWDSDNFYLVMDYCAGSDLNRLIKQLPTHKGLSEGYASTIFRQITHALAFCHSLGVVHRDLKPDNILITKFPTVKIADFGLCGFCKENELFSTYCGSPCYCAPECLRMDGSYDGRLADVWSLGVILYFIVTGRNPWGQINSQNMIHKIQKGAFVIPPYVSKECQNLISGIMKIDPNERLTLQQIMDHPWVKSAKVDGLCLKSRKLRKNVYGTRSDDTLRYSEEIPIDSTDLFNIPIPSRQSISINDLTEKIANLENNHGIHSPFVTNASINDIVGSPILKIRSISLQDIKEMDLNGTENTSISSTIDNEEDSSQSLDLYQSENEKSHQNEIKIPKCRTRKSDRKKTKIPELNRLHNMNHYSLRSKSPIGAINDKMKFKLKSLNEIEEKKEEEDSDSDDFNLPEDEVIKTHQNTIQIPLDILRNTKSPNWKKHRSSNRKSRRASQFTEYSIPHYLDGIDSKIKPTES